MTSTNGSQRSTGETSSTVKPSLSTLSMSPMSSSKDTKALISISTTNSHTFDASEATKAWEFRQKHEQVGRALDKYSRLLLEQKQLHELPEPDGTFVDSIWNFITADKQSNPEWLEHPENTVYMVWGDTRKPIQQDLVTLNRAFRQQDPFTKFFCSTFLNWWHVLYSRFRVSSLNLSDLPSSPG